MFKKILLLALSAVSLSFGSVSVSSVDWHYSNDFVDGYIYDLDVQFTTNKTISTDDIWVEGQQGDVVYYEEVLFKPYNSGWYTFDNYASDLSNGTNTITETVLLVYDNITTNHIIAMPTAIRGDNGHGWGLGIEMPGSYPEQGEVQNEFNGSVQLTGNDEYHLVFTSFHPDAYGTLDIEIFYQPDSNMTTLEDFADFTAIPEPSTVALIGVSFLGLYLARKHA